MTTKRLIEVDSATADRAAAGDQLLSLTVPEVHALRDALADLVAYGTRSGMPVSPEVGNLYLRVVVLSARAR